LLIENPTVLSPVRFFNQQSAINNRQFSPLGFDGGLIDQHDGDVALLALQALRVRAVLEFLLAGRTDQNFQ
jgi:hypothetical protein